MANQTRQLQALLGEEGIGVEMVRVNSPYRPAWVGRIQGLRAIFRLAPYLVSLWKAAGKTQLFHVMANSGKSWHLFAAPAVWIAALRKVPVVVNYRGGEAKSFFTKSMRSVRSTLNRADKIIVPSPYLEQVFGKWGFQAQIVPNIIDLGRFAYTSDRGQTDTSRRPFPHILAARNLEQIYDIATAIRALRVVKDEFDAASMTIAGSGPERDTLQQLTDELDLSGAVTFLGEIGNDQMPELYHSADIVVNPSLADNMPISILEALASGTPVVSTNVGGVPHMVKDGETALLVPPRDASAMAAAILRVTRDPDLAKRLAEAGRQCAHQFTWSKIRESLFAIYEELIRREIVGNFRSDESLRATPVTAGPLTVGQDDDQDRA
jgi:glycosyltransferase involved in cell wall biosynthesis